MPTARYLEIIATQRPFPYGIDDVNRTLFAFNFTALAAAPVVEFEEDVVRVLEDADLAYFGVDTFIGPEAVVPRTGDGPFVQVNDTGGTNSDFTQSYDKYERLSAQVVVRATSFVAARTRALAIWNVLDGRRNTTVAALDLLTTDDGAVLMTEGGEVLALED